MAHQRYGEASYWDDRYTKDPEIFDWYQVRNIINRCANYSSM